MALESKYRLGRLLGEGGMAEVFLATCQGVEGFEKEVAIKRIRRDFSENEEFARMFVNEAKLASTLNHPNIVSVHDFARDAEGHLFLVMEAIHGKDLHAALDSGPVPLPVACFVVSEILRALSFAHMLRTADQPAGVVHRDVSPDNVLLSWAGSVKLSDFGIAKAVLESRVTRSGVLKGKTSYMSPEQISDDPVDTRADLFAVGIVFHELLTGQKLFGVSSTPQETLNQVLAKPIPNPSRLRREVPSAVSAICLRLLKRDVTARFQTAAEARRVLLQSGAVLAAGESQLGEILRERFPEEAPKSGSVTQFRGIESVRLKGKSTERGRPIAGAVLGGISALTFWMVARGTSLDEGAEATETKVVRMQDSGSGARREVVRRRRMVELRIESQPSEASVFLDEGDESLGFTPLTVQVPRTARIRLEREGYRTTVRGVGDAVDAVRVPLKKRRQRVVRTKKRAAPPGRANRAERLGALDDGLLQPEF